MKEKAPLIIVACLITLAAIANLVRLFWNIPISIGSTILPGWTGSIFFLILGLLAAWCFRALCFDPRALPVHREKEEEPRPPFA